MKLKGLVLAGGHGTRLRPLTKVTNKHLLPVARKPMIYYPIERLLTADITEIMIVTGVEHMGDVVNLLGSGRDFGCQFVYAVQDEAGGIAQALHLAQGFTGEDSLAVILGDNVFQASLRPFADRFRRQGGGARILLKEVPDPERFGVAEISDERIVSIEEKPTAPKSNYCVTGTYFYDSSVFDVTKTLKPSARGELEISDVNNAFIERGQMRFDILDGWWSDAGTFESLEKASDLVRRMPPQ